MTISVHPYSTSQSSKRAPAYVAPTTESATFQVVAVNGQTVTGEPLIEQDLVAGASGCTTSGATVTCSTTVPVVLGTVTFQVKTYDQTGAQGAQLGTALASATIVANQANRIALTVSGQIAQVQLFLSPSSLTPGTAGKSLLVVVPQDANGNIIVNPGNYDMPIQLSFASTNGTTSSSHVGFEEDGATTPSATATVSSPNDQVYVVYDGTTGVSGATILANVAETPTVAADVSLTIGTTALTSAPQTSAYLQNAGFAFTGIGQMGTIVVSGGTPPYSASFTQPTAPTSGSRSSRGTLGGRHVQGPAPPTTSVATVTVANQTVTVTSAEYGSATLYISDAANNEFTVPITVSAPAITITVPSCPTGASCGTSGITLPATSTASVTLDYSGGAGAGQYSNTLASVGVASENSACVDITTSGATSATFTSTGSCSDLLIVTSGNQTAYYTFTQPSGTAAYTIASTSHAYSPTAGTLAIADGGQASIALTAGNGPWTASLSSDSPPQCSAYLTITNAVTGGASPTLNNSGFVLAVTTNPSVMTTCTVNFTPTSQGSVNSLTVLLYPKLTVSQQSFTLHAPGDAATVLVENGSPTGLTVASGSIDITSQSTTGVLVTPLSYDGGTSGGGHVGFTAGSATGTALISIRDTNFDEKYGVSVSVDNAYAQSLPTAIGVSDAIINFSGAMPYVNSSIPSWVAQVTSNTTYLAAAFSPGSPGTLTLTPSASFTSSVTFSDAQGGSVTVPITSFLLGFGTYYGSNIGAQNPEAFPGIGLSDSVTVDGPTSYTVTSSNPSVVQVPSGLQTSPQFTATSEGAGLSTITITDSTTGASTNYQASVTSVTIPVLGHGRKK